MGTLCIKWYKRNDKLEKNEIFLKTLKNKKEQTMETIQVLDTPITFDVEDVQEITKKFCIETICEKGTMSEIRIAFLTACSNGLASRVKCILEKSKIHPSLGIVWACRSGHIDIVKILLENGADPNFVDDKQKNWTPMIAAMVGNNWENSNKDAIVNELIKYGGRMETSVFEIMNVYIQHNNRIKQSNFSDFDTMKFIF